MKAKNIDGLSATTIQQEVKKGTKFVYYPYVISLPIITLIRTSGMYMIKAGENTVRKGVLFTVASALFGWWGILYGPKYTAESITINQKGGKDLTEEVMATVAGHILFQENEQRKKAHPL